MKLANLKISTQLRLGFSLIMTCVLLVGALAWQQTELLWQETKGLYDHPLQVRRAIGEIKADILAMHRGMKDICLAENSRERQAILQEIDAFEVDAHRQFEIVFDRYLGPRNDIEEAHRTFVQWQAIRAETIRLLYEGKAAAALQRTRPIGEGGDHVEKMLGLIGIISDFAKDRGDRFYAESTKHKTSLHLQLGIIVSSSIIFSLSIGFAILNRIRTPLKEMTAVTDRFRRGELAARSEYTAANEFGTLATAFNTMAATIEEEINFKERTAQLNAAMLQELEARGFHHKVLERLIQLTGSLAGAVYLLNEKQSAYELFESIGFGDAARISFSATEHEGELGAVLATQQLQRITEIPPETRFTFNAVSGEFIPREIITLPLLCGAEVPALISLASLHGYEPAAVRLVSDMQIALSTWMNSMLANRRIQALTEDLEQRHGQLQTQQEELKAVNEELEEQTRQLLQSEEELKSQQEELEVTNEELEEKNDLLEQQTREVELSRRKLEEKAAALALASKYKSEFLANMSHELRTPLNSLLLLAQGLVRNRDGNLTGEQVEAARIIHGSGSDLLNLINEILDLSRIESGRIELRFGRVLISDLAEGIRDSFQHLADEKGIALDIVVSDAAPAEITSDCKRVEQIIRNLVANAVKFTEKGSVAVTFSRPAAGTALSGNGLAADSCLAITVRDTGIGIPPELHRVIFEAFQQADGGTSRKYGGTGLGLSISRELTTLLGGVIRLESEIDKGSEFTLYLPLEPGRQELPLADRRRSQGGNVNGRTPGGNNRVATDDRQAAIPDDSGSIEPADRVMLVIEDDPDFARLLYGKCHEKGFKCLTAASGEAGLKLATEHLPGAVILDLRLPGMDGWSVLSALKEDTRTRHIPVHIISVEEVSNRALRNGAIGHLSKPVNQEELEEVFRRLERVATGKPKRLLVVDDDAAIRSETVKLIASDDVTVDEAGSGELALTALRSREYDCVVLDLGLPDMDGGELLARLEREEVKPPPVIVYTARDLTRQEETAIRERAESIVVKDVRSRERLLDEVSLFLHRVVSRMPEKERQVIRNLHDRDVLLMGKKVLVVDDDMRTTFAVAHLLADCGMKPLKADNGARALRLLEEQPDIDLVLMDIMMPVMDGYETMGKIRLQEKFRNLPIIALTAKAMPEDREKCLEAGANDYLPKPPDRERLLSMLRVWLCR